MEAVFLLSCYKCLAAYFIFFLNLNYSFRADSVESGLWRKYTLYDNTEKSIQSWDPDDEYETDI